MKLCASTPHTNTASILERLLVSRCFAYVGLSEASERRPLFRAKDYPAKPGEAVEGEK